jgi:hypothetical protein
LGVLESLSFLALSLAALLVPLAIAAAIVELLARRRRDSTVVTERPPHGVNGTRKESRGPPP